MKLIRDYKGGPPDYEKLLAMSKFDGNAQRLHEQATIRMFELNREKEKPVVTLTEPVSKVIIGGYTQGNSGDCRKRDHF